MFYINIAIVGAVSVGKSTLLNTLFVDQYTDTKMRRATALPQIYTESTENFDEKIREKNAKINDEIMKITETTKISYSDIKEIYYRVPKIYDFIELKHKDIYLQIYDLPGLDDSKTSEVYMEYVEENFHKFDIVIYMIDIKNTINRSDEMKILEKILKGISENPMIKLIIIFNKCDEMQKINDTLTPIDSEILENRNQAINMINSCVKKIDEKIEYKHITMSCEDAYIYRMLHRNPDVKLDAKYIDKFGFNEVGKMTWKKTPDEDKMKVIKILFGSETCNYGERIEMTGFNELKRLIASNLTEELQYEYLMSHIECELSCIDINEYKQPDKKQFEITDCDMYYIIDMFKAIRDKILSVAIMFNTESKNNDSIFVKYFLSFMKTYEAKFSSPFLKKIASRDNCANYTNAIDTYKYVMAVMATFTDINEINYTKHIEVISQNLNQYYINKLIKRKEKNALIKYFEKLYENNYKHLDDIILECTSNMIEAMIFEKHVSHKSHVRKLKPAKLPDEDNKDTINNTPVSIIINTPNTKDQPEDKITDIIDYIQTIKEKFGKTINVSKLCISVLIDVYSNDSFTKSYNNLDEQMFWKNVIIKTDSDIKKALYYIINVLLKTKNVSCTNECTYLKLINNNNSTLVLEKYIYDNIKGELIEDVCKFDEIINNSMIIIF